MVSKGKLISFEKKKVTKINFETFLTFEAQKKKNEGRRSRA